MLADAIKLRRLPACICVQLASIVADSPSKAMIKKIKSHSGYYSCPRCTVSGCNLSGRVVFTNSSCARRTDIDFRPRRQPQHHTGESPSEGININIIECFPTDYMHILCLSITGRLLLLWRLFSAPRRAQGYQRLIDHV